jgi:hypothetical protein
LLIVGEKGIPLQKGDLFYICLVDNSFGAFPYFVLSKGVIYDQPVRCLGKDLAKIYASCDAVCLVGINIFTKLVIRPIPEIWIS